MRIGIGQMGPYVGKTESNLELLIEILNDADKKNVEVLVLPELANSGYAFDSQEEAYDCSEEIPFGPFSTALMKWSENNRFVVSGICERSENKLYNSAGIFANGRHASTYRKIHLFNKEKLWFNAGVEEPPVIEYNGFRFGVMICWDWAFPEIARILALKGAHAILHPSNLVLTYCQDAMRTRSIENGVFTATANRIGIERSLEFSGKSQITDHRSKVLLSLSENIVTVGCVDIDLTKADDKFLTERNHLLEDRKPELYKRLIENS